MRGQIIPPSNALRIELDLPELNRGDAIEALVQATDRRAAREISEDGELRLRVDDVPTTWTLKDFYDAFKGYGKIINMEFYEDNLGRRNGGARVIFK